MPPAWKPSIQRSAKLSVFLDGSTRSAVWSHILGTVLKEFNVLAERHDIQLRLSPSDRIPTATAGAEVAIHVWSSNSIAMDFCGETITELFDPTGKEGLTYTVEKDKHLIKAIIFLPSKPLINSPKGPRVLGPKVLMFMALHELLHAAGLTTHAVLGVFQTFPEVDGGASPDNDRVRLQPGAHAWMPPFVLAPDSEQTMRELWPRT